MAKLATCPDVAELQQLSSGNLPAATVETLVGHVETCSDCLAKIQTLTSNDTLVQSLLKAGNLPHEPDASAVGPLIAKLKTLATSPVSAAISFPCLQCGRTLKSKPELAGKKVKCPACGHVGFVPDRPAGSAAGNPGSAAPADFSPVPPAEKSPPVAAKLRSSKESLDFLAPSQAADEIGRLGPYRILNVLGRGGMGIVFRAEDPSLKRIVALKAMLPSLTSDPKDKKRFLREAQTAASISHDHIVTIHQVGEDRGAPYLAMEFLHGEPLDMRLKREGKLPVADVLRIGREVAEGLAVAHDAGLIHRDIKPANIWLEKREDRRRMKDDKSGIDRSGLSASSGISNPASFRVKILDFGLARSTEDQSGLTQVGAIVGTPAYMAPEQANGEKVDQRCDLFSLGCVLYAMATGRPAFKGKDTLSTLIAVAMEDVTPPCDLSPDLPRELSDLIVRLLAKDRKQRPQDAYEVVTAIEDIETSVAGNDHTMPLVKPAASPAPASTPAAPPSRAKSRGGLIIAGGLALAAAVVAGIVFYLPAGNGTIRVEINDDDVEVVLTKTGAKIKGADKQGDIIVTPGEQMLKIKRGDLVLDTDKFVLKKGEIVTLNVEFLKDKLTVTKADGTVLGTKVAKAAEAAKAAPAKPIVTKLTFGELLVSPDYDWSEPDNLGPAINTPAPEFIHELTDDELLILFVRNGRYMTSRRKSKQKPFTDVTRLPDSINSDATNGVTMSGDGLFLVFVSKREGSAGEDLWMSSRKSINEPFGEPARMPEPSNSGATERHPVLSADGLTLLLTSTRNRGRTGGNIWMTRRESRDQPFGDVTRLPEPVNTENWDIPVWISNDGRVLCTRTQAMKTSTSNVWIRPSRDAPFDAPRSLFPWPNQTGSELYISPDGQRLYFNGTNVSGGQGSHDIWMVRRVPK